MAGVVGGKKRHILPKVGRSQTSSDGRTFWHDVMSWTAGDRLFHWSRFHHLGGAYWASSEGSQLLLALTDLTSDDVELTAAAVWTINNLDPEDVDCRQRRRRRTWSWQRSWQRSSQPADTRPPNSSLREANDAKPPVAVVGHSASMHISIFNAGLQLRL
ncbi:hypothetical protein MRX96_024615 [Rhipicephalus microplus]